jgi:hypothetical protein
MFKGFLSRRISYFLMILFIILNSILIYFDIFYLLALPLVILLGYLFVFRLDLIFLTIVFCTPLSFNFENLDLLGIGFYFPTEPLLLVFTLMFLFKALYEKNLKKDLLHYKNPIIILVFIQVLWIFITSIVSEIPMVSFKFLISRSWFIIPFFFMEFTFSKKEKNKSNNFSSLIFLPW